MSNEDDLIGCKVVTSPLGNKLIEIKEECSRCRGTGLYIGKGEVDGAAVVCRTCKGSGCFTFKHEYKSFTGRKTKDYVTHVFRANPGVGIMKTTQYSLSDLGGLPYSDWLNGKQFPSRSELRPLCCPASYYYYVDKRKIPRWAECIEPYWECPHKADKDKCWRRFDNKD